MNGTDLLCQRGAIIVSLLDTRIKGQITVEIVPVL